MYIVRVVVCGVEMEKKKYVMFYLFMRREEILEKERMEVRIRSCVVNVCIYSVYF